MSGAFAQPQIRSWTELTAVVVVKQRPIHQMHPEVETPCAYGMALAGRGQTRTMWGAGLLNDQTHGQYAAVLRALDDARPFEVPVVVHARAGLWDFVKPGTGHLRSIISNGGKTRQGKPYAALEPARAVVEALDAGRWGFVPITRDRPPGYALAEEAAEYGVSRALASQWQAGTIRSGISETDAGPIHQEAGDGFTRAPTRQG